jgi:hypothetical protein
MRPTMHKSMVRPRWIAGVWLAISFLGMVYAEDTQPQGQIYLPPARGGTPLSFQIDAEAKYVAAQGAFLESAAVARKINAEAVAQEIQNSEDYVKAYFNRKDLNMEWRKKNEWKTYFQSLDDQQKATEKRIDGYFQNTLKGDVTNELNWLLRSLYIVQYMSPGDLKPLDTPLTKEDLEQIYLTDGGRGGGKLVFTAGDGEMLKTRWPYAFLRSSAFDQARKEFEDARDAVLKDIQDNGRVSEENGNRILKAENQLLVTLDNVYSEKDRKDTTLFLQYNSAKNFMQSLIVQVNRTMTTNDRSVFNGSLQFKGNTLMDLIQHMCKLGLMFDRPRDGGERVYAGLFTKMRNLYLTIGSEKKNGGETPAKN